MLQRIQSVVFFVLKACYHYLQIHKFKSKVKAQLPYSKKVTHGSKIIIKRY